MTHQPPHGKTRRTKIRKLLRVLGDQSWHSTRELVRRVGHTFAVVKFKLIFYGYPIEKRRHATKPRQWQYRLTDEPKD